MLRFPRLRRLAALTLTLALAAPGVATIGAIAGPQIVRGAACKAQTPATSSDPADKSTKVDCNEIGALGGFVNAADALVSPAVIALAAVAPIACIVGAGAIMFGSRRGLMIIGSALGALVFVISIKGIVA
jgi:hypothetical protein